MGRKLPKKAPKRQKTAKRHILQSYNMARFVQNGKIRVNYDTAYYTNTPYDTSLVELNGNSSKRIQSLPCAPLGYNSDLPVQCHHANMD
jgi:hypothetical protein